MTSFLADPIAWWNTPNNKEKNNIVSVSEAMGSTFLGAIPGVAEAMNAAQAVYHTGSAVYDGVTGDRDGAINHAAQATWNAANVIPGVPEAMSVASPIVNILGGGGRIGAALTGGDSTKVPGGVGGLLGQWAVMSTNAAFGADTTNWIAPGDKPTGTREGEIGAGSAALGYALAGLPGALLGHALGPKVGEFFGSDLKAGTSGARGPNGEPANYAQDVGDKFYAARQQGERELVDLHVRGAQWGLDQGRKGYAAARPYLP